jgi:hypothetical protein
VREIRQIANSSITNNEDASAFGDETESVGEMAKHTWMSIEHAPGIAAHYNRVIVVINPGVTSRMAKVFLPLQKCDFTVSLSLFDRDMSSYHMLLKDKFNDPNDVNVDVFVQLANELLHAELTGDSTLMEVIRSALECSDTIAYITEGGHSRSLQMKKREGLKDYVPPFSEVSDNSIAALGKEIPAVTNENELNITKDKENENSAKVERIIKYLKVMRQMKISYNEDDYIKDKDYREAMIMNVDGENYMKRYVDHKDLDEEQIKERIEKQVEMEEKQEKNANVNNDVIANSIIAIVKEVPSVINDNELNIANLLVNYNKKLQKKDKPVYKPKKELLDLQRE